MIAGSIEDKRNKIALFIPCYNEENRFQVNAFKAFIAVNKDFIDFYFVNDGSKDATLSKIKESFLCIESCFLINLDKNLGKGNALRYAISQIRGKNYSHFGFIDADLDIPLEQVIRLQHEITSGEYLMAISKRDLYSVSKMKGIRSIGSIGMVAVANRIIGLNPKIGDTQCGCKMFKMELLDVCFKDEFLSEWLFDIELFLRVKNSYSQPRGRIVEVPLNDLRKAGKSNFKIIGNLKIIKQLYKINLHYR